MATEDAGLDIDFDAAEQGANQLQRRTDPILGKPVAPGAAPAVDDSDKVTLLGKQFRLSERVGLMPLLKFAHAASSGMNTGDMRSFVAMYEMLRDVIAEPIEPCGECAVCHARRAAEAAGREFTDKCPYADEGDWEAFMDHATIAKAEAEDLLDVITEAIQKITARPTGSPSGSSDGSRRSMATSKGASSPRRAAASSTSRRARRAT